MLCVVLSALFGSGNVFSQAVSNQQAVANSSKANFQLPRIEGMAGISNDGSKLVLFNVSDTQRYYILDTKTGQLLSSLPIGEGDDKETFSPDVLSACTAEFTADSRCLFTLRKSTFNANLSKKPTPTGELEYLNYKHPIQKWNLTTNELIGEIIYGDNLIIDFSLAKLGEKLVLISLERPLVKNSVDFINIKSMSLCIYDSETLAKVTEHKIDVPTEDGFYFLGRNDCRLMWNQAEKTLIVYPSLTNSLPKHLRRNLIIQFRPDSQSKYFNSSVLQTKSNGFPSVDRVRDFVITQDNNSIGVSYNETPNGNDVGTNILNVARIDVPGLTDALKADTFKNYRYQDQIGFFSDSNHSIVCLPLIGKSKRDMSSNSAEAMEPILKSFTAAAKYLANEINFFWRSGGTYKCYSIKSGSSVVTPPVEITGRLLGFGSGALVSDREIVFLGNGKRISLPTQTETADSTAKQMLPANEVTKTINPSITIDSKAIASGTEHLLLADHQGLVLLNREKGVARKVDLPFAGNDDAKESLDTFFHKTKACFSGDRNAFFIAIPHARAEDANLLKKIDDLITSRSVRFPENDRELWKNRLLRGVYGYEWTFHWIDVNDGRISEAGKPSVLVDIFPASRNGNDMLFVIDEEFRSGRIVSVGKESWKTITELKKNSVFDLASIVSVLASRTEPSFRNLLSIFFSTDSQKARIDFEDGCYCRLTISLPLLLDSPAFHSYYIAENGSTMKAVAGNMRSNTVFDGMQKRPLVGPLGQQLQGNGDPENKMYVFAEGTPIFLSAPVDKASEVFYVAMSPFSLMTNQIDSRDWFSLTAQDLTGTGKVSRRVPLNRFMKSSTSTSYPAGLEIDPSGRYVSIRFSPGLVASKSLGWVSVFDLETSESLISFDKTDSVPYFDQHGNVIFAGKIAPISELKPKGMQAFRDLLTPDPRLASNAKANSGPSNSKKQMTTPTNGSKGNMYFFGIYANEFQDRYFSTLKYCGNDVVALKDRFSEFSEKQGMRFLPMLAGKSDSDRKTIDGYFDEMVQVVSQEDTVVIAIASHGLSLERGLYLALPTSVANSMQSTGLDWSTIVERVAAMKAKRVIVLLDACHAGSFANTSQEFMKRASDMMKARKGLTVIAACSASESSLELGAEYQHGAFTQGILDTMINPETLDEQFAPWISKLQSRVATLTGNKQTPRVIHHNPAERISKDNE
jgi:hypothetical protein